MIKIEDISIGQRLKLAIGDVIRIKALDTVKKKVTFEYERMEPRTAPDLEVFPIGAHMDPPNLLDSLKTDPDPNPAATTLSAPPPAIVTCSLIEIANAEII
jgi:hypothetical protein